MCDQPIVDDPQSNLVAELQHRVRNTLATTRMIARRSAELSDSLEDYAAHLDGRLAALTRIQNIFLYDPWAGVDLGRLVTDELSIARAYQDGRAHVDGPDLLLHLRTAEPLALALHELTTNAIKFGALATPSGRLSVTWQMSEEEGEPRLVFDWIELGVQREALEPHRRGFGTMVLEEMLTHTLQAITNLAFTFEGIHYHMVLPLTARVLHRT